MLILKVLVFGLGVLLLLTSLFLRGGFKSKLESIFAQDTILNLRVFFGALGFSLLIVAPLGWYTTKWTVIIWLMMTPIFFITWMVNRIQQRVNLWIVAKMKEVANKEDDE